jgi:pilus biogenesis lipoprotein CpaD
MNRMPGLPALCALAFAALSACTTAPGIDVSERAQPTRIDHVSRTIQIAPQQPLREPDAVSLRRAVQAFGPAEAVHASVAVPPNVSAAAREAVRRQLVGTGVPATNIVFAAGASRDVEVTLHRYVTTPPECRNFSIDLNRSSQENPNARGGCTNERNLTLMIEDPRDLVRGRSLGPADSNNAVGGIQRYRDDKVKPLLKQEQVTTR